jgi:ParB family transcriptional regulator, chromosome partitioning protein
MAIKKRSAAELLQSVQAVGTAIQEQDRLSEVRSQDLKVSFLPLTKILDRVTDTRELKLQHVEDLMMSMAVLGLLEPLVVDIRGRLLAGGHRKAAIYLLKERMPTEYAARFPNESIPVFTLPFDADLEPDLALQVEIAENEKRRDYTRAEVKVLAERLKSAGYSDTQGRPVKGDKPLRPALQVIIGKSIRTVQRYLNDNTEKSTTNVRLFSDLDAVSSLKTSLDKWQKVYGELNSETIQSLDRDVTKLLKRVETALKKSRCREKKGITDAQTSPHKVTYAQMAEEETSGRERGMPTIIDITTTTVTSQTDEETLQSVFENVQVGEEAVEPPIPLKSLKYSVREVSEMERRSRQEIERMRDRGTLAELGWRAEKKDDRWGYFNLRQEE